MKKGIHIDRSFLSCRKFGFTLAEVLITLSIIGVVAAITMPALIQNHKKSVVETRLAKFYSTMNQVVKRAEVDYGEITTWESYRYIYEKDEEGNDDLTKPVANLAFLNKYFLPYMHTAKVENIPNSHSTLIYFSDGSIASFSPMSIIFFPEGKDYFKMNKNNEHKKYIGTKCFTFNFCPHCSKDGGGKFHYAKGVEPYKYDWDGTESMLLNNNSIGCKENVTNERAYCTALIQRNGWKIPKNYPLKF